MTRVSLELLPDLQKKYIIIFEGFILSPTKPARPFLAVIIIKRILSISSLILLYYHPKLQIWTQLIISFTYLSVMSFSKPYASEEDYFINLAL